MHLSVTAGFAVFFMLLAGGTGLSALLLAGMNLTTLDNIHQKTATWRVAMLVKKDRQDGWRASAKVTALEDSGRTFVILETPAGCNPFDAGIMENLRQVLGRHWWDWFLPLWNSPLWYCGVGDSDGTRTIYPSIEEKKETAGLGNMTPQVRSACDRMRRRQRWFPQLLAAAGAPLKTVKARRAGGQLGK